MYQKNCVPRKSEKERLASAVVYHGCAVCFNEVGPNMHSHGGQKPYFKGHWLALCTYTVPFIMYSVDEPAPFSSWVEAGSLVRLTGPAALAFTLAHSAGLVEIAILGHLPADQTFNVTASANSSAATTTSCSWDRKIKSHNSSIDFVSGLFHTFYSISVRSEFNMCETSWSAIISHGDSNCIDLTATREKVFNGPLLGSEAKVSYEDSSGLTTSCGTFLTSRSLTRVLLWSISGQVIFWAWSSRSI